jgi:hypothetical protein
MLALSDVQWQTLVLLLVAIGVAGVGLDVGLELRKFHRSLAKRLDRLTDVLMLTRNGDGGATSSELPTSGRVSS